MVEKSWLAHRAAPLLFTLAILMTACSAPRADEQAIRTLLNERHQALTSRDFTRYRTIISPAYQDKGQDYAAKTAELANILTSWDRIERQSDPPVIRINGTTASSSACYRLRVTRQGKTLELAGEETLRLLREPDGWKIIGGL